MDKEDKGKALLNAVERILASAESIEEEVEGIYEAQARKRPDVPEVLRERVAREVISRYSTLTAVGGGLSSLPAILPGVGTMAAVLGGSMVDMTLCLKYETEMIMALSALFGNDITTERERAYCLLLAGLSTYQQIAGKNALVDYGVVGTEALWNYSPRQLSKLVATVFLRVALASGTKNLVKGIPFAGAIVGFTANKLLTRRVGDRALAEFRRRLRDEGNEQRAPIWQQRVEVKVEVVEAEVEDPEGGSGATEGDGPVEAEGPDASVEGRVPGGGQQEHRADPGEAAGGDRASEDGEPGEGESAP